MKEVFSEMDDEKDLDNSFDEDDSGNDSAPESGSDSSAPPKPDQSGESSNSPKRISDLMSLAQTETARANRAESALKKLKGEDSTGDGDNGEASAPANDAEAWANLLRQEARKTLYAREPRLAEYGIPEDSITGTTPAEMQASLEAQVKLVDAIETRATNRALAAHGLEPSVVGGSGEKPVDYASMSKEEFEKVVAKASRR